MTHKKNNLKSVIEESSSIIKAIEKAWTQVGKPAEFSVKVFETEQKNFLGMSIKSAKVGIFFQDQPVELSTQESHKAERSPRHGQHSRPHSADHKPKNERHERHERNERSERNEKSERPSHRPQRQEFRDTLPQDKHDQQPNVQRWSENMLNDVRTWLQATLKLIAPQVTFTTHAQNYCLKIVLSRPIFSHNEKERSFYRLASYLIMQSLRTSSKDSFRGFKIIMTTAQH